MGKGDGAGDGKGDGRHRYDDNYSDSSVTSSRIAFFLTIIAFVCGLPMIAAGSALIYVYHYSDDHEHEDDKYAAGIVLLCVGLFCVVVGIILALLLCLGVLGGGRYTYRRYTSRRRGRTTRTQPPMQQTIVPAAQHGFVRQHTVQSPGYYTVGQPQTYAYSAPPAQPNYPYGVTATHSFNYPTQKSVRGSYFY